MCDLLEESSVITCRVKGLQAKSLPRVPAGLPHQQGGRKLVAKSLVLAQHRLQFKKKRETSKRPSTEIGLINS